MSDSTCSCLTPSWSQLCSAVAHLRLLRLASARLMRNRCVPFNLNKSNLGTLVAHLAPNWHPHPARQLVATSPGSLARHGALLMSFYCASGVLIAAIFNLIYAPVAQPTRWPTIDFTIKRGKGRSGRRGAAGGGSRVGLSQFHNAFCMFSRVSRICLRNALWPGCARMYTVPVPPSPLSFCHTPLCPSSVCLFVCLCALACPFVASFMRRILCSPPLPSSLSPLSGFPPICSCTPN